MRSALRKIPGVEGVEPSPFVDLYQVSFRPGVKPDEKTVAELFKGCAYNGRKVEVKAEAAKGPRPLPPAPADNPTTPGRAALGKKLFFDARLSAHGMMSCASCHRPESAFAHPDPVAPAGFDGNRTPRNVPTIVNAGYRSSLFLDGRSPTLERQALEPIQHPSEMGMDLEILVKRLAEVPEYVEAFRKELGGPVTADGIAKAIAAYERTLVSMDTPFDRWTRRDETALSESARRGYFLFRDKANCVTCHSGPDFTDGALRTIGWGWDGKAYKDPGRARSSGKPRDAGRFRVPPLRELRWTAPYMHDGGMKTLAEVVEFYDRGGAPGAKTDLKGPLHLTVEEKRDLVAVLESLSSDRPPVDGAAK